MQTENVLAAKTVLNKNYLLLLAGQWVSLLGTAAYEMALPMFILRVSNSPTVLGVVMAAAVIPFAVLGPFGGVLVDRWSRKWIIVACDLGSGLVVLPAAWLAARGLLSVPLLVVTVALLSIFAGFFIPAVMASVPNMVPGQNLTRAMSLIDSGRQVSLVLGPAIGGMLIVYLGFPWAFLINGVSFLLAGAAELFMNVPQKRVTRKLEIFGDLAASWRYIVTHRAILAATAIIMMVNCFEPAIIPVILPIVANKIGVGEPGYAMLRAVIGVGSLISAALLALAREQRRKTWLIVVSMAVFGVALVGSGLTQKYALILVGMAIYGLAMGVANTLLTVLLQLLAPDEIRGRVFALINTVAVALVPVSYILIGAILGAVAPAWVLIASGLVTLLGAYQLWRIKELREV